jgi:hypothetical protein
MAPEQAAGGTADRRADIWSFGCVLFEMITGRPAFVGGSWTEVLVAVASREPDWSRLPVGTPSSVRRLLRRTLTKDLRHRLSDIRDARIEIEEVGRSAEDAPVLVPVRKPRPGSLAFLAIAATLLVALAIPAYRHVRERTPTEMRVELVTPPTTAPLDFALSPDGTTIAFVASGDGPPRLWVRTLDRTDARVLTGTDGASLPFWSPEGLSIGYFARGKLYRVDIAGGVPQALANAPVGRGGAWSADGTIVFAATAFSPLLKMSASGGEAVPSHRAAAQDGKSLSEISSGRASVPLLRAGRARGLRHLPIVP